MRNPIAYSSGANRETSVAPFLLPLLLSAPACGQSISLQLGWGPASWWVIVSLSASAVVAIGLVVLYNVQKSRREAHVQTLDYERLFAEGAARSGLTDPDIARLRGLLRHQPSAPPPAVFEAISLFERCVHAEAERLLASSMPSEEMRMETAQLATLRQKLGFNVLRSSTRWYRPATFHSARSDRYSAGAHGRRWCSAPWWWRTAFSPSGSSITPRKRSR